MGVEGWEGGKKVFGHVGIHWVRLFRTLNTKTAEQLAYICISLAQKNNSNYHSEPAILARMGAYLVYKLHTVESLKCGYHGSVCNREVSFIQRVH